jgi:hypothetical protein
MTTIRKTGVVMVGLHVTAGLIYAIWCVRENYKTGDWSESCGFLWSNPQYRAALNAGSGFRETKTKLIYLLD